MPQPARRSVLIDTSFLITLFSDDRENHAVAKKYYRYFIENKIDMYIPAIVVSEYTQKDSIEKIFETGNFIPLDFTTADGIIAGKFSALLHGSDRGNDSRDAVKNDINLLAQAANNEITFVATDDKLTLAKWCCKLNESNDLATEPITINVFDESIFHNGQMHLDVDIMSASENKPPNPPQ
jgi:hypothetical protein